jgi:hypothetical protein
MISSNRKSDARSGKILRYKCHDSINCIIGKNRLTFQCLEPCAALREPGCGFYAASFAGSG